VVTVSNTYYHFYKTEKGCDSIVYYPVVFQNKPAINLGADDCLEDKDSIILKADTGYLIYNWMNQLSNQPVYVIQNPGTFWVTVTNKCGTASDSITIYKDCEFETYIPSAFTPNNDNINDYFNIPKQNRNKLIELTVYNRYGGIVYKTKDMNAGWNGTFKIYHNRQVLMFII
jgi:gliding motility-associated-like protein